MGWMTKIAGIARIKWVPYVASLWVASVGGVSLYSYMKGKAVVEKQMAHRIAEALEDQMDELKRVHDADLETLVHSLASEQEITSDVENIKFPEIELACEHALHEWMRQFDTAIKTANSAGAGRID